MTRSSRLLPPCGVALLILGAAAQTGHGQQLEQRGSPFAWQYDLRSQSGAIKGILLFEDGTPLPKALVALRQNDRLQFGTEVDSMGHFAISGVPPGAWELLVILVGAFDSRRVLPLIVPADVGITLRGVFARSGGIGGRCGDMVPRGDGIRVRVVDSLSGQGLTGPVVLRLLQDSLVAERSLNMPARSLDRELYLVLPHRVETPGRFDIEVLVPGYLPWRVRQVELDSLRPHAARRDGSRARGAGGHHARTSGT